MQHSNIIEWILTFMLLLLAFSALGVSVVREYRRKCMEEAVEKRLEEMESRIEHSLDRISWIWYYLDAGLPAGQNWDHERLPLCHQEIRDIVAHKEWWKRKNRNKSACVGDIYWAINKAREGEVVTRGSYADMDESPRLSSDDVKGTDWKVVEKQ